MSTTNTFDREAAEHAEQHWRDAEARLDRLIAETDHVNALENAGLLDADEAQRRRTAITSRHHRAVRQAERAEVAWREALGEDAEAAMLALDRQERDDLEHQAVEALVKEIEERFRLDMMLGQPGDDDDEPPPPAA